MPDDKDRVPVPLDPETDPDDLTVCLTCNGSGVLWGGGFCACARGRRRRAESEDQG